MSEQQRHLESLEEKPSVIPVRDLQRVLFELASGTGSFGSQPEWEQWFRYLLPTLAERGVETDLGSLFESTVTAAVVMLPPALPDDYPGFRDDLLVTLGRNVMRPPFWKPGADGALDYPQVWPSSWLLDRAIAQVSSQMFFALNYLHPDEVRPWLESIVAIDRPSWHAHVILWLDAALDELRRDEPDLSAERDRPFLDWEASFLLAKVPTGAFPRSVRARFLEEFVMQVPPSEVTRWADAAARAISWEAEDVEHAPTKTPGELVRAAAERIVASLR